jgi:mono/diheme cytochrome c family protein
VSRAGFSRGAILLLAAALAAGASACTRKPLPEQGTYAERIYANRCGGCHAPFPPAAMTSAMWQMQVRMMQERIARAGMPPLTEDQREAILDYLTRHAGHE